MNKVIVLSAPSGSGKTSIVKFLLGKFPRLYFSISATTREKRRNEKNGKDYYFLSIKEFKNKIKENLFLEWEEVYKNQFYGTLKEEVEAEKSKGRVIIFDIDVEGGIKIKNYFKKNCLSIFIMPPNLEELEKRLIKRDSEKKEDIMKRIKKAKKEMKRKKLFDTTIINDNFKIACSQTLNAIKDFTKE